MAATGVVRQRPLLSHLSAVHYQLQLNHFAVHQLIFAVITFAAHRYRSLAMSSVISLVLPVGYGVVVLEGVLMCLQCFHEGMTVFKVRERIFGKAFGAKHFPSVQQDMQHGPSRCRHSAAQQRPMLSPAAVSPSTLLCCTQATLTTAVVVSLTS